MTTENPTPATTGSATSGSQPPPTETFRPTEGFPGFRVSDRGTVQSCWVPGRHDLSDCWHDLKVRKCDGYLYVTLRRDGQEWPVAVHLLVATAFLGPRPPRMECMIRDGDRSNPRPDNLRWATRAEIAAGRDVRGTQPRGEQVTSAKLTEKDVRAARRRYKTGASISALARRYGVSRAAIRRAIHGENWGHVTGD